MSKFSKSIQAMKERALSAISKKPSAARGASDNADVQPRKYVSKGPPIRFERGGHTPDVFPDGEVCRLLGKNRAYLIKFRKAKAKGQDWDVVEHHAGMTAEWILKECPTADLEKIIPWRIKPGDGIVSVEVLQHTLDFRKLACKRLSDGATVIVTVSDASKFMDGDQFDAQELAGTYRWNEAINRI